MDTSSLNPGLPAFKYSLVVQAASQDEATEIVEALAKLYFCLERADLLKLAETAEQRPELIQMAKRFL